MEGSQVEGNCSPQSSQASPGRLWNNLQLKGQERSLGLASFLVTSWKSPHTPTCSPDQRVYSDLCPRALSGLCPHNAHVLCNPPPLPQHLPQVSGYRNHTTWWLKFLLGHLFAVWLRNCCIVSLTLCTPMGSEARNTNHSGCHQGQ